MWVYIILVTILVILFLYRWDNNFDEPYSLRADIVKPVVPIPAPPPTPPKPPPPPPPTTPKPIVITVPPPTTPKPIVITVPPPTTPKPIVITVPPPVTTQPKTIPPPPVTTPPLPLTFAPLPTLPPLTFAPLPTLAPAKAVPLTAKAVPVTAKAVPLTAKAVPTVSKTTPKTTPTPTTSKKTSSGPITPKMVFRYGNLQVKPSTETYCTAGMYGEDLNNCANSTALFTEANLLDSKLPSFPQTKSTIKVGYLQMGTANPEYISFDPLKYKSSGKVFNKNLGKIAFNYNNVRNLPEIEKTLKTRIDYIASKGANAIRFDEMDTCADDVCNQDNFNQVLINVANYAAMNKNLLLIGNNGRYYSDPDIVTSAEALVNSKLPIAGWTVEQFPDTVKGIREILGPRTPIFGMAATGDEAYTLSNVKDDSGVVMIDGISIYKY